jgi:hypothetical protein
MLGRVPAELLPRFTAAMEGIRDAERLGRILEEVGDAPVAVGKATAGGDPRRLRGVPAVGRGVSGAVSGSQPLAELLRKEARSERPR